MKKLLISAALVFISPSFVLGSSVTNLAEAERELNKALASNNEGGINYWLTVIESLNTTPKPTSTSAINAEEEERLTREFLAQEERERRRKEEEESRTQRFFEEEAHRKNEQQLQQDEELARVLASLEFEDPKPPHRRILLSPGDADFLKNLAKNSLKFDNQDVHAFNAQVVKLNHARLLEIGQKYLPSRDDIPAKTVFDEMRKVIAQKGDFRKVEDSIRRLEGHLKESAVDPETGIHVPRLLSRVWDLACHNNNFRFSAGPSQIERDSVHMIVHFSMPEGLKTGGGCFPGYAGRFFRDYLTLLTTVFDVH